MELAPSIQADVTAALAAGVLPETWWDCEDDACDCTYQRIGMWTNPYLAETLEVRMCCIWEELYKLFPNLVRVIPAFQDGNANEWVTETMDWNGERDMPHHLWYRQLSRREGISVAEAREKYADRQDERPKGKPKESLRSVSCQLNLSQKMAVKAIQQAIAGQQQLMGQVLSEAGLDASLVYDISDEGLVTLAEEPTPLLEGTGG